MYVCVCIPQALELAFGSNFETLPPHVLPSLYQDGALDQDPSGIAYHDELIDDDLSDDFDDVSDDDSERSQSIYSEHSEHSEHSEDSEQEYSEELSQDEAEAGYEGHEKGHEKGYEGGGDIRGRTAVSEGEDEHDVSQAFEELEQSERDRLTEQVCEMCVLLYISISIYLSFYHCFSKTLIYIYIYTPSVCYMCSICYVYV